MKFEQFIRESGRRHGIDLERSLDTLHVQWMRGAWRWALLQARERRLPTLEDVRQIGRLVERQQNRHGWRTGPAPTLEPCPDAGRVEALMAELWAQIDTLTPEEIHRRFMGIHPLADGNARTGLIILVWLTASWHDPLGPATADSEAAEAGFPS